MTEQQKKIAQAIYCAGYEAGVKDLDNERDYDPKLRAIEFVADIEAGGGLEGVFAGLTQDIQPEPPLDYQKTED